MQTLAEEAYFTTEPQKLNFAQISLLIIDKYAWDWYRKSMVRGRVLN